MYVKGLASDCWKIAAGIEWMDGFFTATHAERILHRHCQRMNTAVELLKTPVSHTKILRPQI